MYVILIFISPSVPRSSVKMSVNQLLKIIIVQQSRLGFCGFNTCYNGIFSCDQNYTLVIRMVVIEIYKNR